MGGRGKGTPPRTPKNARRAPALRAHGAARHARPTLSDLKGGERPRDARARPARRGGGRRACWTGCACPFFVLAWKRECCPRARARTRAAAPARARQTPQAAWCDAHTRHRERAAAVAPARAPSPAARQPLSSRHFVRGAPRPRAPPGPPRRSAASSLKNTRREARRVRAWRPRGHPCPPPAGEECELGAFGVARCLWEAGARSAGRCTPPSPRADRRTSGSSSQKAGSRHASSGAGEGAPPPAPAAGCAAFGAPRCASARAAQGRAPSAAASAQRGATTAPPARRGLPRRRMPRGGAVATAPHAPTPAAAAPRPSRRRLPPTRPRLASAEDARVAPRGAPTGGWGQSGQIKSTHRGMYAYAPRRPPPHVRPTPAPRVQSLLRPWRLRSRRPPHPLVSLLAQSVTLFFFFFHISCEHRKRG